MNKLSVILTKERKQILKGVRKFDKRAESLSITVDSSKWRGKVQYWVCVWDKNDDEIILCTHAFSVKEAIQLLKEDYELRQQEI